MFNRTAPAFAAGLAFAVVAGGGIAFAASGQDAPAADRGTAPKWASVKSATRSYDRMGVPIDLDDNGVTDAIAALSNCPRGTQMTGGGSVDFTTTGHPLLSVPDPDGKEAWFVAVGVDESADEDPSAVMATVVCWSPKGQPRGGHRVAARPVAGPVPARLVAMLKERATAR